MSQTAIREYLRTAVGDSSGPADADLLGRFVAARDESAFELLVWRHAALVQRVCLAVLGDHHAAEDAAQATFLVLARKAHTFAGRGSVVGWLYRVSRRVAGRLAKERVRRAIGSAGLDQVPAALPVGPAADETAALWAEVDRLPEHYRVPVLLCYVEGLTHPEAARRTGWPVGTVAGRLARAKDVLARRLANRGVIPAVVLGVPAGGFVGGTAQAAVAFAGGSVVPGVDPSVVRLAEGALTTMTVIPMKLAAAAAIVMIAAAGVWGLAPPADPPPTPGSGPATAVRQDPRPATTPPPVPGARPVAYPIADARQRVLSQNNLKQIMLAFHNYHDVYNFFPRNITDADGKELLSWRVAILPFMEQEDLYRQFKLDEPWDSAANLKLLGKMPAFYRTGTQEKDATSTYFQGFAGPGTAFEPKQKLTFIHVTDGTSNTLGVVEAGPAVAWSKPADLAYDPKKPLPKRQGPFANAFTAGMLDGSVRLFRNDIDDQTLRILVERADGIPLPEEKLLRPKFPLGPAEVKAALEALRKNEKMLEAIADQLREQQVLLAELLKKGGTVAAIEGLDLEQLGRMQLGLEEVLKEIKKETEQLKLNVEAVRKK